MLAKPLQQKLFLFLLFSLMAVTIAFLITVTVSTSKHVRDQMQNNLLVGEKVFVQLLKERELLLFNTAMVLTNDFGFKRAVATNDEATIVSALVNHGERIKADLMTVLTLDGTLTASNLTTSNPIDIANDTIQESLNSGGVTDYILQNDKLYQIILLPIKAPNPIAIAAIGFEIDRDFAENLKNTLLLDVSFVATKAGKSNVISTLPSPSIELTDSKWRSHNDIGNLFFDRVDLVSQDVSLVSNSDNALTVYLSLSARKAFREFDVLQIEIFIISIVASLVIILIGRVGAKKLSLPLKQLATKAALIAEGNFQQDINTNQNIREIGHLAEAFSKMQTGLAEREEKILYQSSHDMMTDLYNRQQAIIKLDELLLSEPNEPLYVVAINICQFRIINESFGYQIGDLCLLRVAQTINHFSPQKLAARIGGDEFLLVLPKPSNVEKFLNDVEAELSNLIPIESLSINLSFSFGISESLVDGENASLLIERASVAQDRTRQLNQTFAFYDHKIEEEHKKRILLLNDLKGALNGESDQLKVYFQPKVGFVESQQYRFEALMRWIHPDLGFISPEYFIPLAEQAGLITQITDWVIKQVIIQTASWKEKGVASSVAINLSARDLARPALLDYILDELRAYQLDSDCLSFEITESDIMTDTASAIELLQRFRSAGFDIAIDDFGTGYSSLSQLKHMPVTELKVDKAFVLNLDSSPDDQIIVKSTLLLAKQFNLKVVAEGVENQASLDLLEAWKCDWIQGFYISKPLPIDDVMEWIQSKPASLAIAS